MTRVLAVLTPEQTGRWKEMTGAPLHDEQGVDAAAGGA